MEVSTEMKLTIGLVTMNRERQVAEAKLLTVKFAE